MSAPRPLQPARFAVLLTIFCVAAAPAIENPVSWLSEIDGKPQGLADCGVMRFNGEYYITGNWLAGHMLASTDLTTWDRVTKVITNDFSWPNIHPGGTPDADNWIHASDPSYANGLFRLHFQVDTELGYATATSPWGPYTQPVDAPFVGGDGIDAHLFIDEDGTPYYYLVRFDGGNVIRARQLSSLDSGSGPETHLIDALDDTWERRDQPTPINEGPEVFAYRGQYYMFYNANDTADAKGNYAFGCVQASSPLGFSNAGKYTNHIGMPIYVMDSSTHGGPGGRVQNVGQPWVVRGLNGFEWFLGYFAIYEPLGLGPRYQAIDRIHFFDRRLYVDGPTHLFTPGYHPGPAAPAFHGLFNGPEPIPDARRWHILSGNWRLQNGELRQFEQAGGRVIELQQPPREHYLFEAGIRFNSTTDDEQAGLRVFQADADNWMIVGLHRLPPPATTNNFYYHVREGGVDHVEAVGLSKSTFDLNAWHFIRVTRNGPRFEIRLDDRVYAPVHQATAPTFGAGLVGLYSNSADVSFDGVTYTVGWDEHDSAVAGWGDSVSGVAQTGVWSITGNGLEQTDPAAAPDGLAMTFKGDAMAALEMTAQIERTAAVPADGLAHHVGIVPVAADIDNWLAGVIDFDTGELRTYGRRDGIDLVQQTAPLTQWALLDTGEATGQSWRYTTTDPGAGWSQPAFDDTAWSTGLSGFGQGSGAFRNIRTTWATSGIWLRRSFTLTQLPTPYTQFKVHHDDGCEIYLNGVLAASLPERATPTHTDFYRRFDIAAAAREALVIGDNVIAVHCTNSGGPQYIDVGIFNPKLPPASDAGYNLRAAKLEDRTIFFVDGQERLTVPGAWPDAQVGLLAWNLPARFNGITVYDTPATPASWTSSDVGTTIPGRTQHYAGTFAIDGAGEDIWAERDSFRFVHQPLDGDGWIEARVIENEPAGDTAWWAKGGVMIRGSLAADAANVMVSYPANEEFLSLQRRDAPGLGSAADDLPQSSRPVPRWLRLKRTGQALAGFQSADGMNWEAIATRTVNLPGEALYGLAVTANHPERMNTVKFDNVRVLAVLPEPWQTADIGDVGCPGAAGWSPAEAALHVDETGADIWLQADGFRFVWQTLAGDGAITARVRDMGQTDVWAKSGVMMRESVAADARHVGLFVSPWNNPSLIMIRREQTAGPSAADGDDTGRNAPHWLRLVREGDQLSGYAAPDGRQWTLMGRCSVSMAPEILVGLAATAHNAGQMNRSVFDGIRILDGLPTPWRGADLGAVVWPGLAGVDRETAQWRLESAGHGAAGTEDAFHWAWRPLSGEGDLRARFVSVDPVTEGRAGLMLRADESSAAPFVSLGFAADGSLVYERRPAMAAAVESIPAETPAPGFPAWLRVTRESDGIRGWVSSDGQDWTAVTPPAPTPFPFPDVAEAPLLAAAVWGAAPGGATATVLLEGVSVSGPATQAGLWEPY